MRQKASEDVEVRFVCHSLAAMAAVFLLSARTIAQSPQVIFDFEPSWMRVSSVKPGIGELQSRLNDALSACGKDTIVVDYMLGEQTARAIRRVRECPDFPFEGDELSAKLTVALWEALFPGIGPPTDAERIGILVFQSENTDYDQFLWNVGQPSDPLAWGTWGPFGATIARGQEVQKIARLIEERNPGSLADAFSNAPALAEPPPTSWRDEFCAQTDHEAPVLTGADLLLNLPVTWVNGVSLSDLDKRRLINVFCDDDEYVRWYAAFRALGGSEQGVVAFDDHYSVQNRRVTEAFARRYRSRGLSVTEVDWAFFLDRGTQFSGPRAMQLFEAALDGLEETASPAERRLAIMRGSQPTDAVAKRLRTGRDMIFLIDSLAEDSFTELELAAWHHVGRRRASQIGVSDAVITETPF